MPLIKNDRAAFRLVSARLWFCVVLVCIGELLFGLDGLAFSSFQVLPSWLRSFGQPAANGRYTLQPERRAVMTSIQWVGKLFGTFIVEPFVHRFGYRWTLYLAVAFHLVGCTLEIATHDWRVFSAGRVFQYVMIGIIENIGPTYIVESVPSAVRAFFIVFIFVAQSLGGVIMLGIFQGVAFWDSPHSWYVPIAVQYLPGIIVAAGTPFFIGRREEAKEALARLRSAKSSSPENLAVEIQAMEDAIEVQRRMASKSGWLDLFRGNNLRRTSIAVIVFIYNQWTGQQFITTYGPTFYASYGLGNLAFTYALLGRIFNLVFSLPVAWCYDRFGRRPCILVFVSLATLFLVLVGALGDQASGNPATVNIVVASLILFNVFTAMGWSKACWIMGPELGSALLRKKTMAFATQVDVLAAFGVTFSFPYMLQAMSNKAVYVYVAVGAFSIVYTIFFVPETRGRSLEELDEIFDAKVWAWQFSKFDTTGQGREMALGGPQGPVIQDEELGKQRYDAVEHIEGTAVAPALRQSEKV